MNILVYNGPGVSANYLRCTIKMLRKICGDWYSIREVSPITIQNEPWEKFTKLIVTFQSEFEI